jgi:hypothetical protein
MAIRYRLRTRNSTICSAARSIACSVVPATAEPPDVWPSALNEPMF